jgi:hypothetical protein
MMRGGGGGAEGGMGEGGEVFCLMRFLIDRSWRSRSSYGCHEAPLPVFTHTTISKHTMRQVSIVKTRENYHY